MTGTIRWDLESIAGEGRTGFAYGNNGFVRIGGVPNDKKEDFTREFTDRFQGYPKIFTLDGVCDVMRDMGMTLISDVRDLKTYWYKGAPAPEPKADVVPEPVITEPVVEPVVANSGNDSGDENDSKGDAKDDGVKNDDADADNDSKATEGTSVTATPDPVEITGGASSEAKTPEPVPAVAEVKETNPATEKKAETAPVKPSSANIPVIPAGAKKNK